MQTPGAQEAFGLVAARQLLQQTVEPVTGWQKVPLRDALGRVLAHDQRARFDVPAHDSSAMDGFAVRSDDLPAAENRLVLVGDSLPGRPFSGVVGAGQAVRIATGAQMPRGADSVMMREQAREENGSVQLPPVQAVGQHVRRVGEDLKAGSLALAAGVRVGPAELGLLASLGQTEVAVCRRPRIAFFAIGDELSGLGRPLGPGEIHDSNRYTLHAALRRLGVELLDMGALPDEPKALHETLSLAAQQADAVITTGGRALADNPGLRELLTRIGEVHFWRLDIKPGRPMTFGRLGNTWLFGLPGNPVAALVNFYQLVLEALQRLAGVDPLPVRPGFRVRCAESIAKCDARREFPRGILFEQDGQWQVRPTSRQGSSVLRSMVEGNCFIILPEDSGNVAVGDLVEVQPFDGLV